MKRELPDPISEVLDDTADEARVQRNWRAIEHRQKERRRPSGARIAAISVLAAAAVALIYVAWPRDAASPLAGPLRLADGAALGAIEGERTVALADGSRMVIDAGARVEPLHNDASAITLLLSRGTVRFEIEPGGPRRWTIETGVASVEVVGTVFTVSRGEGWASVEVERGVVVVRGERVPDRVARLTAGDALTVGQQSPPSPPRPPAESASDSDSASGSARRSPSRSREGAGGGAVATAQPSSHETASSDPDSEALMAQADAARREGRPQDAATLLERAASRDGDPAAGVAAFTLGRLELDALRRPERAARAFSRALELTLPARLREDAAARLVEAHARAGDRGSAQRAADAYFQAYPEGRHAARVRAALAPAAPK